jgi:hypothetical protein
MRQARSFNSRSRSSSRCAGVTSRCAPSRWKWTPSPRPRQGRAQPHGAAHDASPGRRRAPGGARGAPGRGGRGRASASRGLTRTDARILVGGELWSRWGRRCVSGERQSLPGHVRNVVDGLEISVVLRHAGDLLEPPHGVSKGGAEIGGRVPMNRIRCHSCPPLKCSDAAVGRVTPAEVRTPSLRRSAPLLLRRFWPPALAARRSGDPVLGLFPLTHGTPPDGSTDPDRRGWSRHPTP